LPKKKRAQEKISAADLLLFLAHIHEYCGEHGGITVADLAEYDAVPVPIAGAAIQALSARALVRWHSGLYRLTPAGERYLKQNQPAGE